MKTYTIGKPYDTGRLCAELNAAGITSDIRSDGVIVANDNAVDATVNAVIAAHVAITLDDKLQALDQITKTLAACVEALVRIKINQPAVFANLQPWVTAQLTAAHTFVQNQGG